MYTAAPLIRRRSIASSDSKQRGVHRPPMASGLFFASLRHLSGLSARDPVLAAMVLGVISLFALNGGATTIATGVLRIGASGCTAVGPPSSYVGGAFAVL